MIKGVSTEQDRDVRFAAPDLLEQQSAQQARSIISALRACEQDHRSGEMIVSKDAVTGRIHIADGRIAWIHTDGQFGYFTDLVLERFAIDKRELADLLAGCRRRGVPLGEALVTSGVIEPSDLHGLLFEHTQRQLLSLPDLPVPGAVLFLPARHKLTVRDSFSVGDLLAERLPGDRTSAESPLARLTVIVPRLDEVPGVVGAGVVCNVSIEPHYYVHRMPGATDDEHAAMQSWAQHVALHAVTVDELRRGFTPTESTFVAGEHRIFQQRFADNTAFIVGRAFGQLAAFAAAARDALND